MTRDELYSGHIVIFNKVGDPVKVSLLELMDAFDLDVNVIADNPPTKPEPEKPIEPVKPKLFGAPRFVVGSTKDGDRTYDLFISEDGNHLIQEVSKPGEPDAILLRGFNFSYDVLPGKKRPNGPSSSNYGVNAPEGSPDLTQHGYRKRYFGKLLYWEWNPTKLANEIDPNADVVSKPTPEPDRPTTRPDKPATGLTSDVVAQGRADYQNTPVNFITTETNGTENTH